MTHNTRHINADELTDTEYLLNHSGGQANHMDEFTKVSELSAEQSDIDDVPDDDYELAIPEVGR